MPAVTRSQTWVAPTVGNAKMNVDAVVSSNGFRAVGAICRDGSDMFLGASTLCFNHIVDPMTLEALAIREALALADDLYERRI